jgi:YgiT-type zinc finger domain-containing protein
LIEEEQIAKAGAESSGSSYRCESCGGPTQDKLVDVTMWTARQLVLIENVPAHICENCQSQYYDQDVGMKMQDLISKGFPRSQQIREIAVPVFTLDGIKVGRLPEDPG